MRILLIEDNHELAEAIAEYFRHQGHPLDWVNSAEKAESALRYQGFDLLVLDINLPGRNGDQFLKTFRQRGDTTPVLVLTARAAVDDRVSVLDLGADDYLVKPFDSRELMARCRALLRRERGLASDEIRCGNLVFYPSAGKVLINGQEVEFRQREIQLLECFIRELDHIITKEKIVQKIYTFDESPTPNAVEQNVTRLRKKLSGSSLMIKTVRGLGYLAHVDD